jgi:hypothetical protein
MNGCRITGMPAFPGKPATVPGIPPFRLGVLRVSARLCNGLFYRLFAGPFHNAQAWRLGERVDARFLRCGILSDSVGPALLCQQTKAAWSHS